MVTKTRPGGCNAVGTVSRTDGPTQIVNRSKPDQLITSSDSYARFNVSRYKFSGSLLSGSASDAVGTNTYNDTPSPFYISTSHLAVSIPSNSLLATATLALANPNSSDINIPNVLFELKELPGLVKSLGQNALDFIRKQVSAKTFASANLAWQFGISPMVQDAEKLGKVAKAMNNRLQSMQQLRRYGRINKKKRLGLYENTSSTNLVANSLRGYVTTTVTSRTEASVWGISQWVLDPNTRSPLLADNSSPINQFLTSLPFGLKTPEEAIAFRASTGLLRYDLIDLWEIMPWSWAVDYFSNTSEYLAANKNSLGLIPTHLAICIQQDTYRSHPSSVSTGGTVFLSPGQSHVHTKDRTPMSITSAQRNHRVFDKLLTPTQIANLASIVALKGNKRNPNPYMGWANSLLSRL